MNNSCVDYVCDVGLMWCAVWIHVDPPTAQTHHLILCTGTVVAMEKQPGILKPEHRSVIEELRDSVERDLKEHRNTHWLLREYLLLDYTFYFYFFVLK